MDLLMVVIGMLCNLSWCY